MSLPRVAVVILNWNGKYFLEKFLPSVYNSTYPNAEFIIGDNGSTDDSIAFVKQHYSTIRIIQNDQNYGFAQGYNEVLKQVDADYFILLNSDVEVTQGWIEPVIAYLEAHPKMAAAQPKIRSYHNRESFEHAGAAGGFIDQFGFPFCRGRIFNKVEKDHAQYNTSSEVFWASGAALFIKKEAWLVAQGFDGDFFAHMEEIDLCWRLQHLGYTIGYCADAMVFHVGGGTLSASNPQKTYLNFRNNLLMMQKNISGLKLYGIIFARLWFDLAALIMFLIQRKPKDAWSVSRAHQYFFRHLFKTQKKKTKSTTDFPVKGFYNRSIVIDHYLHKVNKFSELNSKNIS